MSDWRVGEFGDVFDGEDLIASIHGDGATRKRNGRIMAAGERMLDALERAAYLIDLRDEWSFAGRHEARTLIREVIAKARGRP